MINHYHIRISRRDGSATIVDERDRREWRFVGGYGDENRLITQVGCDRVVRALGAAGTHQGSIIDALDALSTEGS